MTYCKDCKHFWMNQKNVYGLEWWEYTPNSDCGIWNSILNEMSDYRFYQGTDMYFHEKIPTWFTTDEGFVPPDEISRIPCPYGLEILMESQE